MESSCTLKLPLFSVQAATMESPEHTGMLTPPLHALASVPFQWEKEPGKPHPCTHLIPLPNSIFNEPKCLDPPPRLLYLEYTTTKTTSSSSPTTVLEGPHITDKSSSSSSYSFRFSDHTTAPSIKKSSETGQVSTFVFDKNKLQSREWWRVTVKRRGGKVNRDCPTDCGSECSGSTVKMARLGRNGSFSNLSQSRSHIWIDAVAKSRDGRFRIVSNDEREQTLNQLLTEMDGFDSSSAVIVLGATNRSDVLDPALRRPGRFDRVVMVEAPDKTGRKAILKVHVSKKELPLAQDVDLGAIASMTTGFTGADLANLVNEAALLAGRENKLVVEKIDFIQAVERSIAGIEKKTAKLQGSEKAVVARHEAGHAVVGTAVANLLSGQPRVEKLSILPRSGGALGFTYIPPTTEDRYLLFVDELRGRLVTLLGGRAAEEVMYSGRVSTGALDDIRRATDLAYKAVAEYGLNQTIGPLSLATLSGGGMDDGGSMSWGRDQGHLVDLVQREVKVLLQSALDIALSVVRANPTVLEGLGAELEEKEKVEGEDLQEWLKMVVAPAELNIFVKGKQASILPLQSGSG